MANQWWDDVTAEEVLDGLDRDDGSHDSWGYACDWLVGRCGVDCEGSYSLESIREAVEAEDADLLRPC